MEQTPEVRIGIAKAGPVEPAYQQAYREWLQKGNHADMHYLENHLDLRFNPQLLHPGAKSVIMVALNYYPAQRLQPHQFQFAYYAYGKDYHEVMRSLLRDIAAPLPDSRICCDTAPFLDRYWAMKAGLGWIGKNTSLIIPHAGSFFFLGAILTTQEFPNYNTPLPDHCGNCKRCMEACPTHALENPYHLNASRCLSYLTIENRGEIPSQFRQAMQAGHPTSDASQSKSDVSPSIYGCDRCQQACPHNRFAQPATHPDLQPSSEFLAMQPSDWQALTLDQYRQLFRHSAVKRAKYDGLLRNIQSATSLLSHAESGFNFTQNPV